MKMATKWSGALALAALISVPLQAAEPVKVGSKIDTEGALLGNMIQQVLESHGVKTINKIQLGTTPVVRGAIVAGELDIYPEYTGNGAFFFKDENDPAWKNAQQGYEKVKRLDQEKHQLVGDKGIPRLRGQGVVTKQFIRQRGLQRQTHGDAYSAEPFHCYLAFSQTGTR